MKKISKFTTKTCFSALSLSGIHLSMFQDIPGCSRIFQDYWDVNWAFTHRLSRGQILICACRMNRRPPLLQSIRKKEKTFLSLVGSLVSETFMMRYLFKKAFNMHEFNNYSSCDVREKNMFFEQQITKSSKTNWRISQIWNNKTLTGEYSSVKAP